MDISSLMVMYANYRSEPQTLMAVILTEPGFYKHGDFGIRLENVLEVVDTGKRPPSGNKFLAFKDVTLVPYDPKMIDRAILSTQEVIRMFNTHHSSKHIDCAIFFLQKKWINEYNAKIRELVGEELKKQLNMQAFYWMMNKTRHIIEYLPENEYRRVNGSYSKNQNVFLRNVAMLIWSIIILTIMQVVYLNFS